MEEAHGQREDGLRVRPLALSDYCKGFLDLLKQLTTVGEISSHEFAQRFEEIINAESSPYSIAVVEAQGHIVASGTLLIEKKFIHHCGSVGHIEDVVVDAGMRGHRLGQRIINFLTARAREAGCYKVNKNVAGIICIQKEHWEPQLYVHCLFTSKILEYFPPIHMFS
ncbi:hypothetical protein GOP47_0029563 [Adiantum capillus-veneris]|nr:hypothetical protein GOP47_0029563 [Adiantum capillus-veneris]